MAGPLTLPVTKGIKPRVNAETVERKKCGENDCRHKDQKYHFSRLRDDL